jgi:hypothetical protein
LRIAIHEQRRLFRGGETRRQVHGGRRLSDAALLIRDRDDPSH